MKQAVMLIVFLCYAHVASSIELYDIVSHESANVSGAGIATSRMSGVSGLNDVLIIKLDDLMSQLQALRQDVERLHDDIRNSSISGEKGSVKKDFEIAYQKAYGFLLSGQMSMANEELSNFIKSFPDAPLVADAQYWLGYVLYVQKNLMLSVRIFSKLMEEYPSHIKAKMARLRIAEAFAAMGERDKSCIFLSGHFENNMGLETERLELARSFGCSFE